MNKQELVGLGLSEENADRVLKEHVPYDRFKQVNEEKKALEGQIADLNKSVDGLNEKIKAGDNAEESIQKLKDQLAQKDAQIKAGRKETAIRLSLAQARAKNVRAAMALLDADKLELEEDGSVKGLKEAVEALQKSDAYLFDQAEIPSAPTGGFNPPPEGGKDPQPATLRDSVAAALKEMKG